MHPTVRPGSSVPRKIAYIKRGLFSYSNVRTGEQLRRLFPEYEIEELDVVREILRKNEPVVLRNALHIFREYWRDLLVGRQTLRLAFYRTPFIFHRLRQLIRDYYVGREHEFAFSIQTQSLYDASVPGIPHFVYTDHTHLANLGYPGFEPARLYSRAWVDLEREVYQNAERTFVMSEHVRRSIIEQYAGDEDRIETVFAGSNIDPTPVPLENDGYRNQTVLFVGIDWERKGGPNLLRAFDIVSRKLPNARLNIVGPNIYTENQAVTVLGRLPREEVKRQFTQASVFVMPTRVEPFGIAVIEAFYHRLPVIASDIGAMPGMVRHGETGTLIPPDNAEALAEAMIELLTDPERCRAYGERGRELMTKDYSWDAAGEKIAAGIRRRLGELGVS